MMIYFILIFSLSIRNYIEGGRWWVQFACLSVALNDASAYFAGKCFGKRHLIGLSPNKTVEGFLGGVIMNVLITYVCAAYYLQGNFWQCAPNRLNYGLFEDFQCDTTLAVYKMQEWQLPFSFMGY